MDLILTQDEAMTQVKALLLELGQLTDAQALHELDRQKAIKQAIPPEVQQAISDINAEFDESAGVVSAKIAEVEARLKATGVFTGETVSVPEAGYQAVFSNGRVSYNAKELDAIARSPGNEWLARFREEGKPSISIRKVKRG